MTLTLADKYYAKALNEYPYDLEATIDNLQYALSYNEHHLGALYLMARFYMEAMGDLEQAQNYFEEALSVDPKNIKVGMAYAYLCIFRRDYARAKNILNYLATLKEMDKASLYDMGALSLEYQNRYREALMLLKRARLETFNRRFMNDLDESIKRIKFKIKQAKKMNLA